LLAGGHGIGETERLEVTVVMSDIRGYTTIAEHSDPVMLAGQLNRHRAEMNRAILAAGGTVMQYVGDAVMAVFGAPEASEDHASRALDAAQEMHWAQQAVNAEWATEGLAAFGLGIGLSTGVVAAALLGSEERVEYTLVGDAVNLCQRLQQFAEPGETVLSESTWHSLSITPATAEKLEPRVVKGRDTPVVAYRLSAQSERNPTA
jgi:class 3 adenylate cyclase